MVNVDAQVGQSSAEDVNDEARCDFAIAEVFRAVMADNLDQVLTQFELNGLHLTRILLHSERYKVKHRLVFQD